VLLQVLPTAFWLCCKIDLSHVSREVKFCFRADVKSGTMDTIRKEYKAGEHARFMVNATILHYIFIYI